MATLGEMKFRIADELARQDLSSQIEVAITSAIAFYDRTPTIWAETTGTFTTSSSAEYYTSSEFAALDNDISGIDSISVALAAGGKRVLTPRTQAELDLRNQFTSSTGDPKEYAYYAQKLRFWPIPTTAQAVTVSYVQRIGVPANDAASNVWTTEGEELIRTRAKIDVLENVVRGQEAVAEATRLRDREKEIYEGIKIERTRLTTTGRVVPRNL